MYNTILKMDYKRTEDDCQHCFSCHEPVKKKKNRL